MSRQNRQDVYRVSIVVYPLKPLKSLAVDTLSGHVYCLVWTKRGGCLHCVYRRKYVLSYKTWFLCDFLPETWFLQCAVLFPVAGSHHGKIACLWAERRYVVWQIAGAFAF